MHANRLPHFAETETSDCYASVARSWSVGINTCLIGAFPGLRPADRSAASSGCNATGALSSL